MQHIPIQVGVSILGNLILLTCGGACTTTGIGAGDKGFGLFASSVLFIFKQTLKIVLSNAISLSDKFLSPPFIEITEWDMSVSSDLKVAIRSLY